MCVTTHVYSCPLKRSIALTDKWTHRALAALHGALTDDGGKTEKSSHRIERAGGRRPENTAEPRRQQPTWGFGSLLRRRADEIYCHRTDPN